MHTQPSAGAWHTAQQRPARAGRTCALPTSASARSPFADSLTAENYPPSQDLRLNLNDAVDWSGVLEKGFEHTIHECLGTAFRGHITEEYKCDDRGHYVGCDPGECAHVVGGGYREGRG